MEVGGPNPLTFGPMAVTLAACPEGSMSDRFSGTSSMCGGT
jgi:hypothetical protein